MRSNPSRSEFRLYTDIDDFVTRFSWCNAIHEINYNGLPLHLKSKFHSHGSPTVVVFSHMLADEAVVESIPYFNGDRLTESLCANVLLVADPSMVLSKSLKTGFYAGNSLQPNLQADIAYISSTLTRDNRLIYFGTSSGGFAALVSALHSPGSMVFVSNPVVNFKIMSEPAEHYARIAWSATSESLNWNEASFRWDIVTPFESVVPVKVIYHQNPKDQVWERWHYGTFYERCNPGNDIIFNRSDVGQGHVFPTNTWLNKVLTRMVRATDQEEINDIGTWSLDG